MSKATQYISNAVEVKTGTIAQSGSESTIFDLSGPAASKLIVPAGMTGTSLTFQVSADGSNFFILADTTDTDISITITTAAKVYALDPQTFYGARFIKIVSGSTEAAERTLTIIPHSI